MAAYKRRSGRQFPTWSEILEVLVGLGYAKPDAQPTPTPDVPFARRRLRIRDDSLAARQIAVTLTRNGGVCVDSGRSQIYEFRSKTACDAALNAVRSSHGWTSVEAWY